MSLRIPISGSAPRCAFFLLFGCFAAACDAGEPTPADSGGADRDGSAVPEAALDTVLPEDRRADLGSEGDPRDATEDAAFVDATERDILSDATPGRPDGGTPPADASRDGASDGTAPDDGARDANFSDGAPPDRVADAPSTDGAPPTRAAAPVAVYWGQNGYGGAHPGDKTKYEKSLADVCSDDHVGLVLLSFMTSFISARNGGLPELNFAFHCETPYDSAHPFLLRCAEMETAIAACQARGIRVVISLGGAAGAYGFASDAEGETFAQTMWDMFLAGQGTIRPFGSAVLDGFDLDIEGGATTGYSAFVRKARALMDASGTKHFLITAAPQCVYPDAYLGPATGKPLGDGPDAFDYLLVQFYNNFCQFGNRSEFDTALGQWAQVGKNGRPRLLVGLPASAEAAGGFVQRADVPALVTAAASKPTFAGISLWDVSYDQNNVESGQTYSAVVDAILQNAGIRL